LTLAARQLDAAFADMRVKSGASGQILEPGDEIERVGLARGLDDFGFTWRQGRP
jgi:hypothetical protein